MDSSKSRGGGLMDGAFNFEDVQSCRDLLAALELEARELEAKLVEEAEQVMERM